MRRLRGLNLCHLRNLRLQTSAMKLQLLLTCTLVAGSAWAQGARPSYVKVAPGATPVKAAPGQAFEVPVKFQIASGYHINAEKPTFDYLIPTRLEWTAKDFKLIGIEYPKPEQATFSFSPDTKLAVYQGTITIRSRFQAPRTLPGGKTALGGKLHYQACDDKMCYPPASVALEIPVELGKKARE